MNSTTQSMIYVSQLFFVLQVLVVASGLVICLRYRWLSTSMWLIAGALGALLAIWGGFHSYGTLLSIFGLSGNIEVIYGLNAVFSFLQLLAWIVFVIGLAFVLKDVRDRFQFLREVHESTRDRPSAESPPDR